MKAFEADLGFDHFLTYCKRTYGWDSQHVKGNLYRCGWECALILYLAQKYNKIGYKKMWRHAWLVDYICQLWLMCSMLRKEASDIVRGRLERFFVSGNLMATSRTYLKVPCKANNYIIWYKRKLREALWQAYGERGTNIVRFIFKKNYSENEGKKSCRDDFST